MSGRTPPGPRGHPVLGSTLDFQRDPIGFCTDLHERYGEVARFRVLHLWWYQVSDPELVHEILVRDQARYHKARLNKRIFRLFLGNGVLTADGEDWKRNHRLVKPGFHRRRIDAYAQVMVDYTHELVDAWRDGAELDFNDEMMALTLRVVCKCLFDRDVLTDAPVVGGAMQVIERVLVEHINRPLPTPRWWPGAANRRKVRAIDDIEAIVLRLLQEAREAPEDRGDLLSMLVRARYEDGSPMSDRQLRDELMTLVFAGHETTAHTLVWTWYLLGAHPEVAERLLTELDTVMGGRPATMADVGSLPYLDQVVKESMRLLPSVWTFMREPICDVELGPWRLPQGAQVFISPYIMHRNPRVFSDPERFDPDRWTPEFERQLPKAAFIPFSMGPRVCLGKPFAMMEARLILASLLQRARPALQPGYVPELGAKLSLMPLNGMPYQVKLRVDPVAATG